MVLWLLKSSPIPSLFPISLNPWQLTNKSSFPKTKQDPLDEMSASMVALRVIFCPQLGTWRLLTTRIPPETTSLMRVLLMMVALRMVAFERVLSFT